MKVHSTFRFSVQATKRWLRTPWLLAVTLSLFTFPGCARVKALRITQAVSSIDPTASATDGSTNLHRLFDQLRVGTSEDQVASTVEPAFYRVKTNTHLDKYPFRDLLPDVSPSVVTEWRTTHLQPDGWPEVLFAVFADASKTNVVDAFWFKDGSLIPVVDGLFSRNVRVVKPGDSIETVYRLLGKRNATYFRGPDGKWRVKFIYWAHRGLIFVVEVDAAEGRVVRAGDGTI